MKRLLIEEIEKLDRNFLTPVEAVNAMENFNFDILQKLSKDEISDHTDGVKNTYSQRRFS